MKATLLFDEEQINPVWESAVDKTDIQERLSIPAGTVIDNPDAWLLVVLHKAVPADEECKIRSDIALGDENRLKRIEQARRLRAADGVQRLDKTSLKWLEYMETVYAKELGIVPNVE